MRSHSREFRIGGHRRRRRCSTKSTMTAKASWATRGNSARLIRQIAVKPARPASWRGVAGRSRHGRGARGQTPPSASVSLYLLCRGEVLQHVEIVDRQTSIPAERNGNLSLSCGAERRAKCHKGPERRRTYATERERRGGGSKGAASLQRRNPGIHAARSENGPLRVIICAKRQARPVEKPNADLAALAGLKLSAYFSCLVKLKTAGFFSDDGRCLRIDHIAIWAAKAACAPKFRRRTIGHLSGSSGSP
jgi:hypothetical protein